MDLNFLVGEPPSVRESVRFGDDRTVTYGREYFSGEGCFALCGEDEGPVEDLILEGEYCEIFKSSILCTMRRRTGKNQVSSKLSSQIAMVWKQ